MAGQVGAAQAVDTMQNPVSQPTLQAPTGSYSDMLSPSSFGSGQSSQGGSKGSGQPVQGFSPISMQQTLSTIAARTPPPVATQISNIMSGGGGGNAFSGGGGNGGYGSSMGTSGSAESRASADSGNTTNARGGYGSYGGGGDD